MNTKTAIIAGAGPAGLTAALELLERTSIKPIILEQNGCVGGISRTVEHNGNRMDLGGHRFFSKSERVMKWWLDILPLGTGAETNSRDPLNEQNAIMLQRSRLSRILYLGHLFDYPLSLSSATLKKLGIGRSAAIGLGYLRSRLLPIRPERSLEDFLINRFGRTLYSMFFKDYTEKVWGVPCHEIGTDWGRQRIKGISVSAVLAHAFRQIIKKDKTLEQKHTETSLIGQYLYPKFGPGQLWSRIAARIRKKGGKIFLNCKVAGISCKENRIKSVSFSFHGGPHKEKLAADYFFSSMPVSELIAGLDSDIPENVRDIALRLPYRSFIVIGLLMPGMKSPSDPCTVLPDNWIYIQEKHLRMGRLQIFNNWSPSMVADPKTAWLGCEYFAGEGDELWSKPDRELIALATEELQAAGLVEKGKPLDAIVVRVPKAYPAYFGSYEHFPTLREYLDTIPNLFCIGRNGMHKYNNQDHAVQTAMTAVDTIVDSSFDKERIWDVNTEDEYHEGR